MVEVFKTNVRDTSMAKMLIKQIHSTFADYTANFDLKDCDKILRVKCKKDIIRSSVLIKLLNDFGCKAEVLCGNVSVEQNLTAVHENKS